MLSFDVGANRGDWVIAALNKGYEVIALEPGAIYKELVGNFIYNPKVTPLKMAVADQNYERVTFYEAEEDGLSTLNKDWLTAESMPYAGKPYREIGATTITIDELVRLYGEPDLIKVDVEGNEWAVFKGMSKAYGTLAFEWTLATLHEHEKQIDYLRSLGYTKFGYQFIVEHCEPAEPSSLSLTEWIEANKDAWENGLWEKSGLRPTADVGMVWIS